MDWIKSRVSSSFWTFLVKILSSCLIPRKIYTCVFECKRLMTTLSHRCDFFKQASTINFFATWKDLSRFLQLADWYLLSISECSLEHQVCACYHRSFIKKSKTISFVSWMTGMSITYVKWNFEGTYYAKCNLQLKVW